MQRMVDLFTKACANFGLTISIKKMEVMFQPALGEPYFGPVITINRQKLKATNKFPYLGNVMSDSVTIDDEINLRVSRASSRIDLVLLISSWSLVSRRLRIHPFGSSSK